jgi:hypothetical protein
LREPCVCPDINVTYDKGVTRDLDLIRIEDLLEIAKTDVELKIEMENY